MPNPLLSALPEAPLSIAQMVAGLQATRDGYLADLYNDATNNGSGTGGGTQPDYNLDGRSVSRNAWREHLLKAIADINTQINMLQPYSKKSVSG